VEVTMKIERRSLLVLLACSLLVLGTASSVPAQMMDKLASTTPQERAGIQTAFMKSKLGLQGAELAKVEAVNMKYAEQAEPVIKGSEMGFRKMRQMESIQKAKDAELKSVLTPDQYAKYQASRAEMKQKFEEAIAKKAGASH
jgi:hypothetical protein